jgi:hypothetical protein
MALRWIHTALFIPVLLIIVSQVYKCLYILVHGSPVGAWIVPWAAALWFVGRRARRAWRGEIPKPWLDIVLLSIAAALWGFLVYSQFL